MTKDKLGQRNFKTKTKTKRKVKPPKGVSPSYETN